MSTIVTWVFLKILLQLPVNASESELEERIIQHLAAAAAMGRARHISRREGQRTRSSQGRPRFLVFSTHPNEASATSSLPQREGSSPTPEVTTAGSSSPIMAVGGDSAHLIARPSSAQAEHVLTTASGSSPGPYQHGTSSSNRFILLFLAFYIIVPLTVVLNLIFFLGLLPTLPLIVMIELELLICRHFQIL